MFNFYKIKAYMDLYPDIKENYYNFDTICFKYWIEFKDGKEMNEFYSLLKANNITNGSINFLSVNDVTKSFLKRSKKIYGGLYGEWVEDYNWLKQRGIIIVSSDYFKGDDTLEVIQKIENLINILENDI